MRWRTVTKVACGLGVAVDVMARKKVSLIIVLGERVYGLGFV